MVVNTLIQVR